MKSINDIDLKSKIRSELIEEQYNLKCDKCKNIYSYHKFRKSDGTIQEIRNGCECEFIERGKQSRSQHKANQKRLNIEKVFKQSMMNDDLLKAEFDNYKPTNKNLLEAKQILQKYAANFKPDKPKSLLLQGSYGIGKSHLAMSVVREVKKKGYTALFLDVTELVKAYRNTYNKNVSMTEKELDQMIRDVDLLVIDDYGTTVNDYGNEKLFSLTDMRTGKSNIITTNREALELSNNDDKAKRFSRLMKNTQIIKMHGTDYRLKDFKA